MLTHHPPYPPISGGRVRTYQFLRRLAQHHDITLLCFTSPDDVVREVFSGLKHICQKVEIVSREKSDTTQYGWKTRGRLKWPSSCLPFLSRIAPRIIARLLDHQHFDVIHCAGYYIAQNIPENPGVPVVLAEDNVEFVCAWRRFLFAATVSAKIAAFSDFLIERRLETSVWQSVAACIVTSESEKAYVTSHVKIKTVVVPNGVDVDYFDNYKVPRMLGTCSIGFLANFSYRPNLDSFLYFRDRILSNLGVNYKQPIILIGNAGSEFIAQVSDDPRFLMTGRIPDIRPYLASVDIVVCPLRLGGGTKLKILESLAMRRAVVSTSVGVEGYYVRDREELVIEDSPVAFARVIQHLLSNPKIRSRLGEKGRAYVASFHNWDDSTSLVESLYQTLIAQPEMSTYNKLESECTE